MEWHKTICVLHVLQHINLVSKSQEKAMRLKKIANHHLDLQFLQKPVIPVVGSLFTHCKMFKTEMRLYLEELEGKLFFSVIATVFNCLLSWAHFDTDEEKMSWGYCIVLTRCATQVFQTHINFHSHINSDEFCYSWKQWKTKKSKPILKPEATLNMVKRLLRWRLNIFMHHKIDSKCEKVISF